MAPQVPALREPVQQNDQRTLTLDHCAERDSVGFNHLKITLFHTFSPGKFNGGPTRAVEELANSTKTHRLLSRWCDSHRNARSESLTFHLDLKRALNLILPRSQGGWMRHDIRV
jgi:hypothetical protein